ncbi:MAG TPA: amidohydrolase [Kofleriaceae bacterium]|nr:amidohydrolase [Kofleriaceae bacterium]
MDAAHPRARAIAIRGDRVIAVGSDDEIRATIGPKTKVIDLQGRSATPGLVDAHAHLYELGQTIEAVDLRGTASAEEAAARVGKIVASRAKDEWLLGRGWDQNLWEPKAFPTRAVLDQIVGDRPAMLERVDGHAVWVSTAALRAAGIDRDTKDPDGGKILRDDHGEPTGVLVDNAVDLVVAKIPRDSSEVIERRIRAAAAIAIRGGLTGVHEMGIPDDVAAVYRSLDAKHALPLRVYAYRRGDPAHAELLRTDHPQPAGDRFEMRGVKFFVDGALGSRGARLTDDYADDPGNRGLWVTPPDVLSHAVDDAVAGGWQVAIHAIGDAGNHAVLDAYEAALSAHPGDRRLRVEHCQVLRPDDIPRFAALGVIASMQPTHATSDMPWAEARVGPERIKGAYAWRSILATGAVLAAGSDFPVEEPSPILGLYAAVTRQDKDGNPPGGWYPAQRMTLEEALRAFTVAPAFAAFAERDRGVLAPGRIADVTVFDRALAADRTLLRARADLTIVGGEITYRYEEATGE